MRAPGFGTLLPLAVAGAAMLDVLAIVGVVWFAGFAALAALLLGFPSPPAGRKA